MQFLFLNASTTSFNPFVHSTIWRYAEENISQRFSQPIHSLVVQLAMKVNVSPAALDAMFWKKQGCNYPRLSSALQQRLVNIIYCKLHAAQQHDTPPRPSARPEITDESHRQRNRGPSRSLCFQGS